jgi:hypothetical protein
MAAASDSLAAAPAPREDASMMTQEKKRLSLEEIETQTALELPDRELLSLITITNVLNGLHINVTVKNVNVAVQICAVVDLINVQLFTVNTLECQVM